MTREINSLRRWTTSPSESGSRLILWSPPFSDYSFSYSYTRKCFTIILSTFALFTDHKTISLFTFLRPLARYRTPSLQMTAGLTTVLTIIVLPAMKFSLISKASVSLNQQPPLFCIRLLTLSLASPASP